MRGRVALVRQSELFQCLFLKVKISLLYPARSSNKCSTFLRTSLSPPPCLRVKFSFSFFLLLLFRFAPTKSRNSGCGIHAIWLIQSHQATTVWAKWLKIYSVVGIRTLLNDVRLSFPFGTSGFSFPLRVLHLTKGYLNELPEKGMGLHGFRFKFWMKLAS